MRNIKSRKWFVISDVNVLMQLLMFVSHFFCVTRTDGCLYGGRFTMKKQNRVFDRKKYQRKKIFYVDTTWPVSIFPFLRMEFHGL